MASSSAPVESKAEAVASLERLEQCINEVHSRLDAQQNSRFVTRFTEKNFLTHRCMNMYDKWRRMHLEYMKEVCHINKDSLQCSKLQSIYLTKNAAIKEAMQSAYKRASGDEIRAYEQIVTSVSQGGPGEYEDMSTVRPLDQKH